MAEGDRSDPESTERWTPEEVAKAILVAPVVIAVTVIHETTKAVSKWWKGK
jgi:hypothetical protein